MKIHVEIEIHFPYEIHAIKIHHRNTKIQV